MPITTQSITTKDIQEMVTHWFSVPVEGYLGSNYGQNIRSLLAKPMSSADADGVIKKMKKDLPILGMIPDGQINIYLQDTGTDKKRLIVDVSGHHIEISQGIN